MLGIPVPGRQSQDPLTVAWGLGALLDQIFRAMARLELESKSGLGHTPGG